MIPVRVENLLPGGKNLGVTHITNGAFRLHPVEWNVGEAAGILAAFCLERKVTPRAVRNRPRASRGVSDIACAAGHRALLASRSHPCEVRHGNDRHAIAHRDFGLLRRHEPGRRGDPRGDPQPAAGDRSRRHHRLLPEPDGHARPAQGRAGRLGALARRSKEMVRRDRAAGPLRSRRRRHPLRPGRRGVPAGGVHRPRAGRARSCSTRSAPAR